MTYICVLLGPIFSTRGLGFRFCTIFATLYSGVLLFAVRALDRSQL